jgi:hypothetical protein
VVNQYGEMEGLVTLKDIFEELVDKFTTRQSDFGRVLFCNDEDMAMMARGQSEETRSHARPGIVPGCAAHAQRPDCRALAGQSRGGSWRALRRRGA